MSTAIPSVALVDHLHAELCWTQPRTLERSFQLQAVVDDKEALTLATLTFASALGSLATGQTASGAWTFKRVGFFRPRITVRTLDTENNVAIYEPRWTGTEGVVTLADTRSYRWRATNFWATHYEIVDGVDQTLLTYQAGCARPRLGDILRTQARLEVTEHGAHHPDLDLFALLGWYLIILYREDQAATAAAVASVTMS